ncbi:putative MHC class I antigen protein [Naja naja]|nr:putative MHC class I antigen protein [Naja naja]
MFGCELRRDGSKGGFIQDGYNGRTFLTFDKETLTWVAPIPKAQITKRRWDADTVSNQRKKAYLEEICIEWLERYLSYGKETLLRTEPPVVTMSSKSEVEDGMEAHVCRLDGFYPSEIDASWTRDGEVWVEETFHGFLAPNTDGTYHYWLSIWINPKERGRYRCHVEHDGLQEPLDLALEEPTNSKSNLGLIIGCVVAALVLVGVIAGILVFFKRRQDDYNAVPTRVDSPSMRREERREDRPSSELGRLSPEEPFRPILHAWNQDRQKAYLEETCIQWLEKYLSYGKETLLRTGASSHFLKYFYTGISEPSQGQPHFVVVGFVDDQLFSYYDSNSRKLQPRVSWIEKYVGKEEPKYWETYTRNFHGTEETFKDGLETLRNRYNQSEGE